ncbi:hypothetical protein Taro_032294 [Colocasia esculenta]|uniref:Retrotransposon gag domain-containing protein n=1 Tax=Colocasia esculenta TaxID=4460 RepID=A0A843W918_COLES|nr:hypothetical protein [Colocasia esculenta]
MEDPVALRVPRAVCLCMVMSLSDCRYVLYIAMVSGALAPVALEEHVVYAVDMVFTWFERYVSARGLSRYLCTIEVCVVFLDTLTLVRESRRLLAFRLVLSGVVVGLGLHHQQCNFLSLYTSGYAPGLEMADMRDWGGGGDEPEETTSLVERFLRLQLPTYSGGPNPDTAEHWVHEIERGSFPTELVTCEAHPYFFQRCKRKRTTTRGGVVIIGDCRVDTARGRPHTVQDKKEVLRMTNKDGIFLDQLAWWLIQHVKEIGEGLRLHVRHVVLGSLLTSAMRRRQPSPSRSGHDGRVRRVPNSEVFFNLGRPNRAENALLGQEGFVAVDFGRSDILVLFLAWSRREDVLRSGGNAGVSPFFTIFAKVRESRRLLTPLLVRSRTVAELVQIQQAKREQFRTLQQGNLSMLEYQMRFMVLSRYAPYVVTDNTMMVEYFIRGLRPELQDAVIPLMCRTVEEAAQKTAILERTVLARQFGGVGTGSFQLPQQSTGISKGKAPLRASSSSGFAKWGGKLKKMFRGRGGGRQEGFQLGVQQGRGVRPALEES